jgi:diguanylate cyclase (GGDEF)-like protein/putative nucleotidyltransferase with HDIG domain
MIPRSAAAELLLWFQATAHIHRWIADTAMKHLPQAARFYVAGVIAAGAILIAVDLPLATFDQPALFFVFLTLSSLTSALKVPLPIPRSGSTMSVSYAVDFAALLLLGPHETMVIAMTSAWAQCTFRTRDWNPPYKTLFSMASLTVTVQATGFVYQWLGGVPGVLSVPTVSRPLVGAAMTYFALNSALVAGAIALSTRQGILAVWSQNFLWAGPSYLVGAGAAAIGAVFIHRSGYWLAMLTVAPLYLTYRTYKVYLDRIDGERNHIRQLSDLHLATIEALALAIDAKDQTAHTHIRRVQTYAAALARSVGMTENEVRGVTTAALLHDIGKLAVPEHILSKPGPLSPEEFQKIRTHPQVGSEIIAHVPFPYPVAPLIASHHERWDGKGYPSGSRGEEIPLGARILTVVDYFDALVRDRPYHKAVSHDAAVELLRQEAGKALDPHLVERFLDLWPELRSRAGEGEQAARRLSAPPAQADKGQPTPEPAPAQSASAALENIALAHREIYALYEIAQAMGTSLGVSDTMTLIASKLSSLVPFSCCALFLYEEDTDILRCRFAQGADAHLIRQVAVKNGQGLTGWVARNRRPLVNARPSADFEAAGQESVSTTLKSTLACPLIFNERLIGTIQVYHADEARYTDDHRRLLDRVSEQAAAVIANSVVFEQTREDSLSDPLTGLPNTRFMFMHLTRELARAERTKGQVALLVMDLDGFKQINDIHGHHVGDRALCEIATVLRHGIRPYDICVRYAGDEFIVVLSGCNAEEAEAKRIELQRAVDAIPFEARPGRHVRLGVSIGAAVFPRDGRTYESLLAAADRRMYQDKADRRSERTALAARRRFDVAITDDLEDWDITTVDQDAEGGRGPEARAR